METTESSRRANIKYWAIGIGFLAACCTLVAWIASSSPDQVRHQLIWVIPKSMGCATSLLIIAILFSSRYFQGLRQILGRSALIRLGCTTVVAILLAATVPPVCDRILWDEDIYQNIAQNISHSGAAAICDEGYFRHDQYYPARLQYNKQPNGYPFVLSLVYSVCGIRDLTAHVFNMCCFALCTTAVFVCTLLFFNDLLASTAAALVFATIPQNLVWAATSAAEPSTALFGCLSVLAALLYWRLGGTPLLLACSAMTALAIQFRPESLLIVAPVGLIVFHAFRARRRPLWHVLLFATVLLGLAAPHVMHMYAVRDEGWGTSGPKFSLEYVTGNLLANSAFYYGNKDFPSLIFCAALLGCLWRGGVRSRLVVIVWFLLLWGIFIPFYAGSYRYGADVRFSVLSYAPLAMLAGRGLSQLAQCISSHIPGEWFRLSDGLVLAAVICATIPFMAQVRETGEEGWDARVDRDFAQSVARDLPDGSVVITHNPNMYLLWGRGAAQTYIAMNEPETMKAMFDRAFGGIYFHYDYWCQSNVVHASSAIEETLRRFHGELWRERICDGRRYAFYKLNRSDSIKAAGRE